jgi:hypothetical protein
VLAKLEDPDPFGIGPQVARARLTLDPARAAKSLLPITRKNALDAMHALIGLADDARAAKKAKRKSLSSAIPSS